MEYVMVVVSVAVIAVVGWSFLSIFRRPGGWR